MRRVLTWSAVAASLLASAAGSVQAMTFSGPSETAAPGDSLTQQLEAARRALDIGEADPGPTRQAQWFNWPNWGNWSNWSDWGNWTNWLNW